MTKSIEEKAEELYDMGYIDGTEVGAYWISLANLENSIECASKEFHKAYIKEINAQHKFLKKEFKLVVEEQTVTQKVRRLEYIG